MSTHLEFDLPRACPVSELVTRPLTWLWPGRLARGKLAILDGDPGIAKSFLTLDLAARLSTGRRLPASDQSLDPLNVLILNGEDSAQDTIRPRLQASGADLAHVFVLSEGDSRLNLPLLSLPTHTRHLDAEIARTQARLVVLDPVVAFLSPSVNINNDQSVRQALFPLAQLADRHQCAILLVRHLNKTGGTNALYRGGGSIGFLGACRSGWLLAAQPGKPENRVLAQVKNNLAAPQASLSFNLLGDGVPIPTTPQQGAASASPHAQVVTLSWHGPCDYSAHQLLARPVHDSTLVGARQRACDFLSQVLEDGPLTSRELWAKAEEQGITVRTLQRGAQELNVRYQRLHADGKILNYWLLPNQQLPTSVSPDAAALDLEPWLGPLREKFPPSTPLDEP